MSAAAIRVESLSKRFWLPRAAEADGKKSGRLRGGPFQHLLDSLKAIDDTNSIWALQDISFQIAEGEAVSILGTNGSGKSTLLKILSRVLLPTSGRAIMRGRVGALLEVGTGFHPELTGRENVYLNGAMLGMPASEVRGKFDQIVEFSEIGKFIDTPVKRYSSGMRVRLGFAVAASLQVDVLMLDEVLAVGDLAFRQRCYQRVREMLTDGRSVVMVSHDTSRMGDFVSRGIWLKNGKLVADGEYSEVADSYFDASGINDDSYPLPRSTHGELEITAVHVLDESGAPKTSFAPFEPITVKVEYQAHTRIPEPRLALAIGPFQSSFIAASNILDGANPSYLEGKGVFQCTFERPPLMPGQRYIIRMSVFRSDGATFWIPRSDVRSIEVKGDFVSLGFHAPNAAAHARATACGLTPYRWLLPDGTTRRVNPQGILPPDDSSR